MGVRSPWLLPLGLAIGAVAATCGIGGGLFAVPLLHYTLRMPLKSAVATSLCLVFATALSATVTEALHPDRAIHVGLVSVLIAGSLGGAQLGHRIATRISTENLKAVFSIVLLVAGLRLLLADSSADAVVLAEGFEPGLATFGATFLVGFCAGVAVPLLGVGGGLIVVPSLLFFVPEIGYLGARAASLGMAVVTSLRSIFLYKKSGLVDWQRALWFGAGALIGAALGVAWVHGAGHPAFARRLLGGILCFSAARFAFDAWRSRRHEPGE